MAGIFKVIGDDDSPVQDPLKPSRGLLDLRESKETDFSPNMEMLSTPGLLNVHQEEIPVSMTIPPEDTNVGILKREVVLTPEQFKQAKVAQSPVAKAGADEDIETDPFRAAVKPFKRLGEAFHERVGEAWEMSTVNQELPPDATIGQKIAAKAVSMAAPLMMAYAPFSAAYEAFLTQPVRAGLKGVGVDPTVAQMAGETLEGVSDLWLTGGFGQSKSFANTFMRGVRSLSSGMGASKSEAIKEIGRGLQTFAAGGGPESGKMLALSRMLQDAADSGKPVPPRMIAKAVDSVLPEESRFGKLWGNMWEVIEFPFKAKVIPTYKEGRKSLAEIFQPAVERLEKSGLDRPFREARAKKQLSMRAGEELGADAAGLKPSERLDLLRGLKGGQAQTTAANQVLHKFNTRLKSFDLGAEYEKSFSEQLQKRLGKIDVPEMDNPVTAERIGRFFDDADAMLQGKVKPAQIRKHMTGLLEDPNVDVQMKQIITDLYNLPADTPQAVAKASNRASKALMLSGLHERGAVSDVMRKGDMLISDKTHQSFRSLWGKYVPRDVWLETKSWQDVSKASHYMFNKWFMTPWKTAKVVMRPATHVRNIFSNFVLNDLGGLPVYRMDVYGKALSEIKNKGKLWQEYRNLTGAGGTFTANDIAQLSDGMRLGASFADKALTMFDKTVAPVRSLYNAEEQFFKLAKFMHNKSKGMDGYEAALDAMKWTFNYGEVTRATARARATLMPFFTWQSKVLPLMAQAARKNPLGIAKWFAMYEGLQMMSLDNLQMGEDEWKYLHYILPEYIADGQFLMLPFRDDKQRLQMLNLTYMIPGFGDITQISQDPWQAVFASPLLTVAGALTNNRTFSGAPLYYEWEEPTVKAAKTMSYVWKQLVPSWMPGGQDQLWSKLYDYATEHPDAPTWYQIMGQELGFKIQAVDEAKALRRRHAVDDMRMSELESEFLRKMREAGRAGADDETMRGISERFALLRQAMREPKEREAGPTNALLQVLGR